MKFNGSENIMAVRSRVWSALNDPQVLKECVPGCESFERSAENTFELVVKRKIGPVKANFRGEISLTEIVDSESCVISGEGKGGAAGSASGKAEVRLSDSQEGTLLEYQADAQVRGKIAQLGARLINPFVKKTTTTFFERFRKTVEEIEGREES